MPEGIASFPVMPVSEQNLDQRWDHDKAEDMAYALKEGAGVSAPGRGLDFDAQIALHQNRQYESGEARKDSMTKIEEWSNKTLEPLEQIYDRDPQRFGAMPTRDFMDVANRIINLEAREKSASAKLEELERDVESRKAALRDVRAELNELLHPSQEPPSPTETQG